MEGIHLLHSTNDSFNHSLHLSSKDTIRGRYSSVKRVTETQNSFLSSFSSSKQANVNLFQFKERGSAQRSQLYQDQDYRRKG